MDTNIFDSSTQYLHDILTKVRMPNTSLKNFPGKSMAFVFLTKFCDVKCAHCFFRSDSEVFDSPKEQYEFSKEGFEKLLEFINASNNGYLAILGGGEPFKKFDYILDLIKKAKTDRIVFVTSGVWASTYAIAKDMIFQMYEALCMREHPPKIVLRISVDKWHLQKISIASIYHIIDVFREFFPDKENFQLQLHTMEKDDCIDSIMEHYENCSKTLEKKYVSDNNEVYKVGYRRYRVDFSDGYTIPIGVARLFSSNLKVNLNNPPTDLKERLALFDDDIENNCFGNPSLVKNADNTWGLDFLISYNGNVATWGNDLLCHLNNLYTDSYEQILDHFYHNVITYSFMDKGYSYRMNILNEVNPTAVLRSKAIHIRDYAGASLMEENKSTLYYAIRVMQEYLKHKLLTMEDLLGLPIELLHCILSAKRNLIKQYHQSLYSIVRQYMEKEEFVQEQWQDLFNLIHLGHYAVSKEQLHEGIRYYNDHTTRKIRDIDAILDHSKEQYVRLNERLTFMKPEAKALCLAKVEVKEEVTAIS